MLAGGSREGWACGWGGLRWACPLCSGPTLASPCLSQALLGVTPRLGHPRTHVGP